MGRVAVAALAVVGLLMAAAGLIAGLAWGIPALGLNIYGRNPLDETLRGLGSAATLYAVGAALLAIAIRWIRDRSGSLDLRGSAVPAVTLLGVAALMAVRGNWTGILMLLVVAIGISAPIALGGRPWGTRANRPVRS